MKIAVLIKDAPDMDGIYLSKSQGRVIENKPRIMERVSANALEAALQFKETAADKRISSEGFGTGSISVIALGKKEIAEKLLRNAYALGADELYILSSEVFLNGDHLSKANALSAVIKKIGGIEKIFAGQGQIGYRVSEETGVPIVILREGGNTLRIPSALKIMKSAKVQIKEFRAEELGVELEAVTEVVRRDI